MAPRKGKRPSPNARGPRGKPPTPRNRARNFVTAAPAKEAATNSFSMRDEARNTASHQSSLAWSSGDARLRQNPVAFVSAGFVEPLKEEKPSEVSSDVPSDINPDTDVVGESVADAKGSVVDTDEAGEAADHETALGKVPIIETTSAIVEQAEPMTADRAPLRQSVGNANSLPVVEGVERIEDKELFFFDLGDDESGPNIPIPPSDIPSPRSSVGGSDSSEEVILFRGRTARPLEADGRRHNSPRQHIQVAFSGTVLERKKEETAAAAKGPNSQRSSPPAQAHRRQSKAQRRRERADKAKEDEEDEILADYIANMAANSDDDLLGSQPRSLFSYRDIGGDDDAVNFGSADERSPDGNDSMDDEFNISNAEGESTVAEDDDQGMDADIDDETFAQLLAKQEELGTGGDELRLFSDAFAFAQAGNARHKSSATADSSQALDSRPSATQVADAFDNLGLDDWRHLTGQSRKRRSKQPPNFNVSDSEIEAALKTAWQRDRERKKTRKLEREALRAEGLLGKDVDPEDLRIKYPSGLRLDDIKAELTSFLLGSAQRLDFPPLDKQARRLLHSLADKLDLKSRSAGQGDQRHTVYYRTGRTVRYTSTQLADAAGHVERAATRIRRTYFHRTDVKKQRTEPPRNTLSLKALVLREGEVVGASVPELGQANKGRTMLEKMGWTKGMALGAEDNKGILEPVAQVMKRSKAGLG